MVVLIAVIIYLTIGGIAVHFYNKRDIKNTKCIKTKVHDYVNELKLRTEEASDILSRVIEESSIDHAGWWYWRRKKPFNKLSMKVNNAIGFLFWIIDIIFCEIGFQRELQYVNKYLRALSMEKGV